METLERPGLQVKMDKQPEIIKDSYRGSRKLEGKVALITGGDSGIGQAVAVHFAREGANVAIAYLSEDKDAEITKKFVEDEGGKCIIMRGDLRDNSYCDEIVNRTVSELGGINILVNNAATQYPTEDVSEIKYEHIKETFDTNIVSMIYLTSKVVPHLDKGDRIINTTSVTGYQGHELMIDYSATKGAITSFTRALSQQLVSKGILVNGIAPGPIWTPLIPATMGNVPDFGSEVPMKRPGQPSEVAPGYVFLASEDSTYISGQVIHINGGVVVGG